VQLQGPGDAHGGQAPAGLIAEIKGEEVTEARR
jgi:hypothetical protein